jgi:RimJ/RimL family protein N-acetyltransferase
VLLPKVERGHALAWAIIEKSSSNFAGLLELRIADDDKDSRGFWLGRDYWGKGYISEAVIATTDYAFNVLKRTQLILTNDTRNTASSNVKKKSNATLLRIETSTSVVGPGEKEVWELRPEAWRASPLRAQYA